MSLQPMPMTSMIWATRCRRRNPGTPTSLRHDKQGTAKSACKGVGVVEGEVSALQLPKPPAPNSSSADGVENPPRNPVRHTSVSGHAANLEMMDERGVERKAYSKEAPSKSAVVHSSKNHLGREPCGKPHGSGKQNRIITTTTAGLVSRLGQSPKIPR